MSNISDWIKNELYPSLFEIIDTALPEHEFKRYSGGWRSKTYLDGSPHKDRIDKTVVTKKAPGHILEQGGEVLSLVDYVIKRDGVEFITAVKTLAKIVGLQVPDNGSFNPEVYKKQIERANLLEDANSYFTYSLELANNSSILSTNRMLAEGVRGYLFSRGYSSEDIKAMELGIIESISDLSEYLHDKSYSKAQIDEFRALLKDTRIGSTHKLTIPYRSGGIIKGFKFRTIGGDLPKYLNTPGLDKSGGLFNLSALKGDKDLVIVEGELDALHATAKGVENVVALGGDSLSSEQVKDALRRGAKRVTICLDREPGKEEETDKKVNKAIEVILAEGVNRVYIVTLTDLGGGKTDPDRLIKERGVEEFKKAIAQAMPYYEYRFNSILDKYRAIESREPLTPKQIDTFLDEIVGTSVNIKDATDRDRFKKLFTSYEPIKELGITEESFTLTIDRLTSTRDKEAQAKEFKRLLSDATALQDKGEVDKALDLLDSKVREVKLKDKATEFNSLLLPIQESDIRQRQATKPDSLNSGYKIGGEDLLLPSGALSILTAPTSHGKTTFLINLSLNVAQAYPDKETYLFSYEEDGDSILLNTLNTYLDKEVSQNNRKSIKSYFATGSTDYIQSHSREHFNATKERFFKGLIDTRRLNINYSSYNSDTLIEAIRYLHKHANPGAIFIDYIQLLNLPEGKYKTYSRQEEIKEICIALKDLAVETGLPIILGAQFNRTVTNQLHLHATRIGEAGDIERIANLIVGFWNNNFPVVGDAGELKEINAKGFTKDTLYTVILKNRGGRVGLEDLLSFNGNTGKIKNIVSNTGGL